MSKLIPLLLVLCAGLTEAAAGDPPVRDELIVALQLEPPVLDPTGNPAAPIAEALYGNLFEGLVSLAEDGTPRPLLAESWTLSDDGLDYRFQLRPGVRFHDGTPFDAETARFSLERARAADSLNPQKSALTAIREVAVEGPYRLRVSLNQRRSGFLQTLGLAPLVMVSPTSAPDNASHPVGTGPLRFSQWRRGDRLDLERNPHYWRTPIRLERLSYRFISDPSAAFSALMAGDIDAFPNYPAAENMAQFEADPRFAVTIGSTPGKALLALNNARAPLDRLEVRRAIAHALDRTAIIDGALYGHGQAIGSHYTARDRAYLDLTGRYPYDPQAARRLLGDTAPSLSLALPPPAYARRTGEIVAAQLAEVGIRVHLENLEWAQWLNQVYTQHDYDMTLIVHAEPLDYDIYARDGYYFGYRNAAYAALLAELDDTLDPTRRDDLLRAVQTTLTGDAVNAWLFTYPLLSVQDIRLQGVRQDGLLSWLDVSHAYFAAGTPPRHGAASGSGLQVLGGLALGLPVLLGLLVLRRFGPLYLLARLGVLAATLLAASLAIFVIVQGLPGDPARYMLGLHATPEAVELLRTQLGLDGPLGQRYLHWLGGLAHGDFGISYSYRVAVAGLLSERLQLSLPLACYALALALLLALPVGLLAAAGHRRWPDLLLGGLAQLGVAVPGFWIGMLLVLLFSVRLGWVPAGGFPGWQAGYAPALAALTLPAIALALPQAAVLARVLRGALLEASQEDYMRTARAKGYGPFAALYRHALPNALIPLLTILGLQFGFLLAGGVIIEQVFFLPGLGRLVFQAIGQRDLIVVQAVVMLLVFAVVILSFLVELAYALVDPRLRHRSGS